jgi:hypothetical protein
MKYVATDCSRLIQKISPQRRKDAKIAKESETNAEKVKAIRTKPMIYFAALCVLCAFAVSSCAFQRDRSLTVIRPVDGHRG